MRQMFLFYHAGRFHIGQVNTRQGARCTIRIKSFKSFGCFCTTVVKLIDQHPEVSDEMVRSGQEMVS